MARNSQLWLKTATLAQEIRLLAIFGYFGPFLAQKLPFLGPFDTLYMKQNMFLAPIGASYNIATRKHIFGKQEQTKLGKIASKITKKTEKIKKFQKKNKKSQKPPKKIFPGL